MYGCETRYIQRLSNQFIVKLALRDTPTGRRTQGRSRWRGRDNIINDLKALGINGWQQVVKAAETYARL